MANFAITFLGTSFPIPDSSFARVDATHFVLDVGSTVTPDYQKLKEVCLFVTSPATLPDPSFALGLYISLGGQEWQFRGYVSVEHPSEVMPLQWPATGPFTVTAGTVQLGIAVEPLAELRAKEGSKLAGKQEYAKLVARDLYNYMTSFNVGQTGDQLVVPTSCLESWMLKFDSKFKHDPDFLLHSGNKSWGMLDHSNLFFIQTRARCTASWTPQTLGTFGHTNNKYRLPAILVSIFWWQKQDWKCQKTALNFSALFVTHILY